MTENSLFRHDGIGFSDSVFLIQVLAVLIHLPSLFTFPLDTSISLMLERKGINVNVPVLMLAHPLYHMVIVLFAVFSVLYTIHSKQSTFLKSLVVPLALIHLHSISGYFNLFWFSDNFHSLDSASLMLRFFSHENSLKVIGIWFVTSLFFIVGISLNVYLCKDTERVTSRTRKWFHLLLSANALVAFYHGEELLFIIVASVIIVLLTFVEVLRANGIFFAKMTKLYNIFKSEDDDERFEFSHISLFLGIVIPLIYEFIKGEAPDWTRAGLGICTVGLGDSFAALVGSRFRSNHSNRKTIQGSIAYFFSCLTAMLLLSHVQSENTVDYGRCVLTSLLTCIVEATVAGCDNVILPLLAILVY
ncbi:hypothetical protein BEWA_025260 [Theileria equi strain WA]|uniref:dolichol kinase n=1 Tax=Theileria equi strain WA TaxID=1537102 RepID=L0AVP1_THEEQ|nr:hypothetical protein BEWA_025260 [Theileria equi strain WA]AFZ79677.1 hypothetical protein BEWA_025260 [Theileria equi strain WA]|eukprot:XP_004829343.1 hypothetical protein BEWA_025260 [Theileria equi strain WA]